jgi:hypothetical protein
MRRIRWAGSKDPAYVRLSEDPRLYSIQLHQANQQAQLPAARRTISSHASSNSPGARPVLAARSLSFRSSCGVKCTSILFRVGTRACQRCSTHCRRRDLRAFVSARRSRPGWRLFFDCGPRRPVHTHCVGGRHDATAPAFLAFLARGDARIRRCWVLEGWRESSGADLPGVAKMWASSGSTLEKGTPHLRSMCVRSTERGPFVRAEMIIGRPYRP